MMVLLLVIYSSRAMFVAEPIIITDNYLPQEDSIKLHYPIQDQGGDFINDKPLDNIDLKNPSNIDQKVDYDPASKRYILTETIGGKFYRSPTYMTFDEFLKYQYQKDQTEYWKQRNNANNLIENKNAVPKFAGSNQLIDRLFGPGGVDIRPSGNVELTFGVNRQKVENPTLIQAAKKQGGFDFDMNINMNLVGKIGDKMKLTTNYNTQATFDFENQIKLEYTGHDDEIIQSIGAGNVSLPLNNSLITGNQSLFGIKTKMKFGRLNVTTVLSQQKSKSEEINIQGGAQTQTYSIQADQYEDNKHFFLSHFFRDNYNTWLKKLPIVQSGINITRVEVWITNKTGVTENVRDIVGTMDLAEYSPYQTRWQKANLDKLPKNENNSLYSSLKNDARCRNTNSVVSSITTGIFVNDPNPLIYEKTFARKLAATEYVLYPQLGFLSLQQTLNSSDVLAVAYEYTYNGKTYKVGEFSEDIPTVNGAGATTGTGGTPTTTSQNVLFLKLLKSQIANTTLPLWKLMMKNIYSLGAYQISATDFKLDVTYLTSGGGEKRYLTDGSVMGVPLIRLLNLDRLNTQNDPTPDGIFDFIPNITIIPQSGRLIFPVIEPFGNDLKAKFQNTQDDQFIANKYVYQELYDKTKTEAQQYPEKNRFNIKGSYKSNSASEIYLGAFNLPQGSVKVSSGGQELKENVDYSVDYNLGRVKILNEGIMNSGQPIKVKFENNAFAGLGQVKTFIGNRFDYYVNEHLNLGATWLHLSERPFTQKVLVGDDPISNAVVGGDVHYSQKSGFITKALNKLPIYESKEKSNINVTIEAAKLIPGHSKAIGDAGQVYIDDFEGAQSNYDLKFPLTSWAIASTPQNASRGAAGQELFPESHSDSLNYGFNRGKLAWYNIDPYFTRAANGFASNLTSNTEQSNLFIREIEEKELFPDKQLAPGTPLTLTSFDVFFNPKRKGPYNFDYKGMNSDGSLANPTKRWGGITRSIEYSDFETANIEFVEFWMLDPYSTNGALSSNTGDLYFNLGTVSEDILKDHRKFYENGLPRDANDVSAKQATTWGFVPTNQQPITNAFDNDQNVRAIQDVGYDGCTDDLERTTFARYVGNISTAATAADGKPFAASTVNSVQADPSNDNYHFYRGTDFDNAVTPILERYKRYNNAQGNSPTDGQSPEKYSTAATNIPESEDINKDNSLSESENYFQYRVHLQPNMQIGSNFVNNVREAPVKLKDGSTATAKYYQFKIPISSYEKKIGTINDFKSIRFIRMYLNGFSDSVICRFAKLQMTRNQWRRYPFSLESAGEQLIDDHNTGTYFNVTSVNLEENASKQPVGYILPPGIERTNVLTTQANVLANEQSISLQVCGLKDGDARAVYKTLNLDMRTFKEVKFFIHAESTVGQTALKDNDLYGFIRFGTDFTDNYYEYAVPLKITGTAATDPYAVWPDANTVDLFLDSLTALKQKRIAQNKPQYAPFKVILANGITLTVKGTPDLGLVKTCMMGVRNPQRGSTTDVDDGQNKCGEIWFDELRLSGFDENGGYAALLRTDIKLADLGTISASGTMHTIGYGSLEQKLAQRFKDNFYQYNVSGNVELGKLLPEALGLKLPLYASISEQFSNPQYDPYQLDVKLKDELAQAKVLRGKSYADSLKYIAQDYVGIKSWNLTNVRINRPKKTKLGKLNLPTNIENFNVSYSFTETFKHNPTYESDVLKKYKGGIGYNYAIKQKYITPFSFVKFGGKYLALIRDFNFNILPSSFSFKADADRQYGETHLRRFSTDEIPLPPTYNKYFTMMRNYSMRWDVTRSISIDFNATNNSRIDEPYGKIDTKAEKDTIINRIKQLKRTIGYNHSLNASYMVPLSKFPLTDWITMKATYASTYTWVTAPLTYESLGNTLQNTQNQQLNTDFNFNNLYNKVKFLKRYNTKTLMQQNKSKAAEAAPKDDESQKGPKKATTEVDAKGKVKKKNDEPKLNPVVYTLLKPMMSLKRISVNLSQDNGTVMPGYLRSTRYLGMDSSWQQPGWQFLTGQQISPNYLNTLSSVQINALSGDTKLFTPFTQRSTETWNITANLEPITDMRVDLTVTRTYSRNLSENYKRPDSISDFAALSKVVNGSMTVSFIALNTFFDKTDKDGFSGLFKQFEAKRKEISKSLGTQNPYSQKEIDSLPGYYQGYGPYSQSVLIPAFLSTYANPKLANSTVDQLFKLLPKPNWRVSYTGLSKLPGLKKLITQANINHAYNSTFNVGSFMTNPDFLLGTFQNSMMWPYAIDSLNHNFVSYLNIPMISITEQFAPLIGVDITWKNNITTKVDYKRNRTLNMSFIDYQLSETRGQEITIGMGYKRKGITLPFKNGKKKVKLDNDLTFRFDFSYRNDKTANYKLDQNIQGFTRGMKSIGIAPYIDYVVNNRVNIRLFYDYRRTIPATSASFPITAVKAGIKVRFTLAPQ
ncbi:MAG: cell surface protein SprA [Bacteroidota bacterium]|jgi:cell surface protein SprA